MIIQCVIVALLLATLTQATIIYRSECDPNCVTCNKTEHLEPNFCYNTSQAGDQTFSCQFDASIAYIYWYGPGGCSGGLQQSTIPSGCSLGQYGTGFSSFTCSCNSSQCTTSANCSDHAVSVCPYNGECSCTCRNQWSGTACGTCPYNFDSAQDCGACAAGHSDSPYPHCATCTINGNCSGHATSVMATGPSCQCKCRNAWGGVGRSAGGWAEQSCHICPKNFDANADCGACSAGYVDYPYCNKQGEAHCSIAANCSGHAYTVQATANSCECECSQMWYGWHCDTCGANFDRSKDCNECAPGFYGFPSCVKP